MRARFGGEVILVLLGLNMLAPPDAGRLLTLAPVSRLLTAEPTPDNPIVGVYSHYVPVACAGLFRSQVAIFIHGRHPAGMFRSA